MWVKTLRKKAMKRITGMKIIDKKSKLISNKIPFHDFGLTKLILSKNFLGSFFMKQLIQSLNYDEYMRYIDISDNKIPQKSIKDLINGLALNKNIVYFDIRTNPCHTQRLHTKLAIRLVKNIETMIRRKEILKKKWINLELLKIEIPEYMQQAIKSRFKIEVNDDSMEAKNSIIGNPTYENFIKKPRMACKYLSHKISQKVLIPRIT
jgi:Ran GTPase-activating protein (RanGAP) involved in mRNA processing and transport